MHAHQYIHILKNYMSIKFKYKSRKQIGNPLARYKSCNCILKDFRVPTYMLCIASYYKENDPDIIILTAATIYNTKSDQIIECKEFDGVPSKEEFSDIVIALSEKYNAAISIIEKPLRYKNVNAQNENVMAIW